MILYKKEKNSLLEFLIIVFMIVLTRVYDLATTFILTPDLKHEVNPFIAYYGKTWYGFILFQLLIFILVILSNYYSLFRAIIIYPAEKGLTFGRFQLFYMFGKSIKTKRPLEKLFGIFKINMPFIGYLLPRLLILFSFLIGIFHTFLIFKIYIPYFSVWLFYGIIVIGVGSFEKLYMLKHYKIYQRQV